MAADPLQIARQSYDAYARGDRSLIEPIIADDFRFTSPLDNRLDRQTYFERCWPNHQAITGFDFISLAQDGDRFFVTYEGRTENGRFRNTEVLTVRDGQIHEAEVYFGWSLPHPAPEGGWVDEAKPG